MTKKRFLFANLYGITTCIFCLVHGTTTPFHVEIDSDQTVSHLKDAIKAKMTRELDGWAAKGLRLWKVQIPDDPDDLIEGQQESIPFKTQRLVYKLLLMEKPPRVKTPQIQKSRRYSFDDLP